MQSGETIPVDASQRTAVWLRCFGRALKLWLFMMVFATVGRIGWLFALKEFAPTDAQFIEYAKIIQQGARQDCVVATFWLTPLLLTGFILSLLAGWKSPWPARLSNAVVQLTIVAYCLVTPFLLFASIGNYMEFQDSFNAFSFEFFHGNHMEVIQIAIEKHGLIPKLLACAALTTGLWYLVRRIDRWSPKVIELSQQRRGVITALMLASVVPLPFAYRGSWGLDPFKTQIPASPSIAF